MSTIEKRKRIFFYIILFIVPYLMLGLLELGLRLFSYGDDLRLFIQSSDSSYYQPNPNVGKRFFNRFQQTAPLVEYFLKVKPANGYRIFVLGESTTQGFPYDANVAFPRILKMRLQDIFLERKIEVINLGMTAVSSYTLLDFTDEILKQKPDAILIYTGHNEYYGALGVASMENGSIPSWLKRTHLKLIHLKTYQLVQNVISGIKYLISPATRNDDRATLMEKIVGKNIIPYKSKIYSEGLVQFSDNMSKLLTKFKNANVPVIISDQVSNVRDLPPFRSQVFEEYPSADSVYAEAKIFESKNQFVKAKEEYLRAKDLDVIRFRATEELNSIIEQLADSIGVYKYSMKSLFEKYSVHEIVGNNLMTEHLHPDIDGYFLMSEGFLKAMKNHGMIENKWDSSKIKSWRYYRENWGFTELDSTIAALRVAQLKAGWPFKPETSKNNFIYDYKPKGMIDSLALMNVRYTNITLEKVHKQLAAYYESVGDLKRASKEYLALAYAIPINSSYFYQAADLAYKSQDYNNVILYLKASSNADTSSFAQYTLASIYTSQQHYSKALECIEKFQKLSNDKNYSMQVLRLKYKIQQDSGLSQEAEQTLKEIKQISPDFQEKADGKSIVILIPTKIKPYIEKAEALRKSGLFSESLITLQEANKIQEIPYTDLLIGKLLLLQKDISALYYLEKAHKEIKNDPSLVYGLCILYIIKNDAKEAKNALDEFNKIQGVNHPQSLQLKSFFEKRFKAKK